MGFAAADRQDNHTGSIFVDVRVVDGTLISDACAQAVQAARRMGVGIRFVFGRVVVRAWDTSDVDDLVAIWHKQNGSKPS